MFASKTPRDLNHDPEPWLGRVIGMRARDSLIGRLNHPENWDYHPRPEFDHVQHNEPNPILVAIRTIMTEGGISDLGAWYADAATYLTGGSYALGVPIPPGASLHARRVLERLANFSQIGA